MIKDCKIYDLDYLVNKIESLIEEDNYKSDSKFEGGDLTLLGKNDTNFLKEYCYLHFIKVTMCMEASVEWWSGLEYIIDCSDYEYDSNIIIIPLKPKNKNKRLKIATFTFDCLAYIYNYLTKRDGILDYEGEVYEQFNEFCRFIEEELPYGYQLICS